MIRGMWETIEIAPTKEEAVVARLGREKFKKRRISLDSGLIIAGFCDRPLPYLTLRKCPA